MNSHFDAYEIIGLIAPGSVFLFGAAFLFPELKLIFYQHGFSIGDFGLFLVLSLVVGHLVQAAGNLLEGPIWKSVGGMPTDWLISKPDKLLDESQLDRLRLVLKEDFHCNPMQLSSSQWAPIVREIYAAVQSKGNSTRIDSFNRTYGLMRGVTAALGTLGILTLVTQWPEWEAALLLLLGASIAGYRMVRFGKRYGRELFVAFLQIQN